MFIIAASFPSRKNVGKTSDLLHHEIQV